MGQIKLLALYLGSCVNFGIRGQFGVRFQFKVRINLGSGSFGVEGKFELRLIWDQGSKFGVQGRELEGLVQICEFRVNLGIWGKFGDLG